MKYNTIPQVLIFVTLLIFAINISFPANGFVFWFFAGFFMLLVLMPAFLILLALHIKALISSGDPKRNFFKKINIFPWVTIVLCLVLTKVIAYYHWNEPFYNDAYEIRVELFPDGSCEILFDGESVGLRSTHRYDWFGSKLGDVSCRDQEMGSHASIDFDTSVGVYPIFDTEGDIAKNGGALFDDALSRKYSPSFSSSVYWDFVDGEINVLSIGSTIDTSKPKYEWTPSLSVIVNAIGKRRYRGP